MSADDWGFYSLVFACIGSVSLAASLWVGSRSRDHYHSTFRRMQARAGRLLANAALCALGMFVCACAALGAWLAGAR